MGGWVGGWVGEFTWSDKSPLFDVEVEEEGGEKVTQVEEGEEGGWVDGTRVGGPAHACC